VRAGANSIHCGLPCWYERYRLAADDLLRWFRRVRVVPGFAGVLLFMLPSLPLAGLVLTGRTRTTARRFLCLLHSSHYLHRSPSISLFRHMVILSCFYPFGPRWDVLRLRRSVQARARTFSTTSAFGSRRRDGFTTNATSRPALVTTTGARAGVLPGVQPACRRCAGGCHASSSLLPGGLGRDSRAGGRQPATAYRCGFRGARACACHA